jgi:hypothetical protein
MSALAIEVSISGMDHFDEELQRFRNAVADRAPMHARMAVEAAQFTRDYLISDTRHRTAERLGGTPTGFRAKNAKAVQARSDASQASVLIPRSTGLGRAFGDVIIRPGSGRTYLTIPAHQETHGKHVRDFPEDTFEFRMILSWKTFTALVFTESSGRHEKGEVGFWLKREVKQKQDRKLLPYDEGYHEAGRRAAVAYIANHIYRQA